MRNEDLNNEDFIWDEPEEPKKTRKAQPSPSPKSAPKPKPAQRTRRSELSEDYALLQRERSHTVSGWGVFRRHMGIYFFYNMLFRTLGALFFFIMFIVLIALPAYRSRHSDFNLFDFIRQTFSSQALYADYERGEDVGR